MSEVINNLMQAWRSPKGLENYKGTYMEAITDDLYSLLHVLTVSNEKVFFLESTMNSETLSIERIKVVSLCAFNLMLRDVYIKEITESEYKQAIERLADYERESEHLRFMIGTRKDFLGDFLSTNTFVYGERFKFEWNGRGYFCKVLSRYGQLLKVAYVSADENKNIKYDTALVSWSMLWRRKVSGRLKELSEMDWNLLEDKLTQYREELLRIFKD